MPNGVRNTATRAPPSSARPSIRTWWIIYIWRNSPSRFNNLDLVLVSRGISYSVWNQIYRPINGIFVMVDESNWVPDFRLFYFILFFFELLCLFGSRDFDLGRMQVDCGVIINHLPEHECYTYIHPSIHSTSTITINITHHFPDSPI